MENNKIICPNCQKEIKATDRFCIGCGTQNEHFSDEVKNEQNTIEILSNDVKYDTEVKAHSAKNRKIFIGAFAAVAVLLVIVFVAPSIYAIISPNNFVKTAISNTFKDFAENGDKFSEIPTVFSLFGDSNGITQKEMYFKIDDIRLDEDEYIDTSLLKDYGIKLSLQSDDKSSNGNLGIMLMKADSDIIDGNIYYNNERLAVEAKKLFKDILGVKINDEAETSEDTEYNEVMESVVDVIKSSKDLKVKYLEFIIEYEQKLSDLLEFKKDESNSNLYTAVINSDDFVEISKEFIVKLFNDEGFKKYLADIICSYYGYLYSAEYYEDMIDNIALSLPDEIDYILEEVQLGDLIINAVIDDKHINSLNFEIDVKSADENYKIKYSIDFKDEENKKGLDFSFKVDSENEIELKGSVYFVKDGKNHTKNVSFELISPGEDLNIVFKSDEKLKENKIFQNIIEYDINSSYYDINVKLDTNASYKNKNRIDYENIKIDFYSYGEVIGVDMSGYVSNSKIEKIETIEDEKITYIDNYDEQDFDDLYNEIMRNLYLIMENFGVEI